MSAPRKNRTCAIEGCDRPHRARGWCNMHHQRWRKHGDPMHVGKQAPECSVEGCTNKNFAHTYCKPHYGRWRWHGDPLWTKDTHCRMDDCAKTARGHGLCSTHYFRWRKYGDPFFDGRTYIECSVPGCYEAAKSKGWCSLHYNRWYYHGDPLHEPLTTYRKPMGVPMPVGPLTSMLADRGGLNAVMWNAGIRDEVTRCRWEKALSRAVKSGSLDLGMADEFAVLLLGTHPALIWGEDYWDHDEFDPEAVLAA